jgi:hypothetical protein
VSENLTHESLKVIINQLPRPLCDIYFQWRRTMWGTRRNAQKVGYNFDSPEFVAECLQKLLALHAEVDKRAAMLSGDGYTDSDTTQT